MALHGSVRVLAALLLAAGSAGATAAAAAPAGNASEPEDVHQEVAFVNSSDAGAASLRGAVRPAAAAAICSQNDISAGRGFSGDVEAQQECPGICSVFSSECRRDGVGGSGGCAWRSSGGLSYCGCESCSTCTSYDISAGRGFSGNTEAQSKCPGICGAFNSECRRDGEGGSGGCAWANHGSTSYCGCEVCS